MIKKKRALITGATSGIGMEFARQLADLGYDLVITGRRIERLEDLKKELVEQFGCDVKLIQADLSNQEQCYKLLDEVREDVIDVFINNAGFGTAGRFTETSLSKEISMIKVNDIALHILFKEILRKMQERDKGYILNVASSAGLMPGGPYMATYYATKAYVVSLTRAVATELKHAHSKVYVSALCPGPVNTEFNQNADVVFALKGITPEKCVRSAIAGMKKHRLIIVPARLMSMAMYWQRFAPISLVLALTGRQQKKKIGK